ncbi:MAG TPA: SagB/ThcOx family dehydrogenase [Sumerlaeia bacterium]|nr:SagB/ThcOx family dehydrogenase [Sumerlaeia bacterium]
MARGTGLEFMEKTKFKYAVPSDQQRGVAPPPLQTPFPEGGRRRDLPEPHKGFPSGPEIADLIASRRSVREYGSAPLSLKHLAYLLWATQGLREVVNDHIALRTVPSAGARHALETHLLVNRVEGLEPGLYRYLALEHKLGEVSTEGDLARRAARACLGQTMVLSSAVTFVWVAVRRRMQWRYGERGFRYLYLDAGHVCQNLYLAAESIGCGACAIGAFDDDAMNALLDLDGDEEFVIYLATLGEKK